MPPGPLHGLQEDRRVEAVAEGGRVDRIGQKHIVRALNFALADTVELRVREVLEEKLARILEEFGVDKLADVLDSRIEYLRTKRKKMGHLLEDF